MKNKWKVLFFTIVGINLVTIIIVIGLIMYPSNFSKTEAQQPEFERKTVNFNIKTTKSDLNDVINHYIQSEDLTGDFHYEVRLSDDVELHGIIPIFSQNVALQLAFNPEALETGDLLLRQKSMKIGELPLPVSYVLKFINDNYKFPNWVQINPKDESIYVALREMKLKSNLQVEIDKFDLPNDDIEFSLIIPTE